MIPHFNPFAQVVNNIHNLTQFSCKKAAIGTLTFGKTVCSAIVDSIRTSTGRGLSQMHINASSPSIDVYKTLQTVETLKMKISDSDQSIENSEVDSNKPLLSKLNEIILSAGTLIKDGKNSLAFSKKFYSELNEIVKKMSPEKSLDLIVLLLQNPKEIEKLLNNIVVGESNRLDEKNEEYLNDPKQIENIMTDLQGIELRVFIAQNAPLSHIWPVLKAIRDSKHMNPNNSFVVTSSILFRLNESLINEPASFIKLKSYISFLDKQATNGAFIGKSVLESTPLDPLYIDSANAYDDEESFSDEIEIYTFDNNLRDHHNQSMDHLKKLAALRQMEEFKLPKFDIKQFTAMVKDVQKLLGDIDPSHPQYAKLNDACGSIIDRYTGYLQVLDILDLTALRPSLDSLFAKLGHAKLTIDNFTENDRTIVQNDFHNQVDDLLRDIPGLTRPQAIQMVRFDWR